MALCRAAARCLGAAASASPARSCSSSFLGSSTQLLRVVAPVAFRPFRATTPVQMGRRSAKIAGRKGKADAKKSKLYGKMGKRIIQLVKSGGPDPLGNAKLHDVLKQARDLGVPRDIIDRNLKRASDHKQADYTEVVYEAYGPGGTGFLIDCLTDNVNRSASDVKAAITKSHCKVAEPGSVLFNFKKQGLVVVQDSNEDAVFEAAMEVGADDIQPVTDEEGNPTSSFKLYTAMEDFSSAQHKLEELGLHVNKEETELVFRAVAPVEVDDEAFEKCEALIERLLELDDVDAVYTNTDGLA